MKNNRLDIYVAKTLDISRNQALKMIKAGEVLVNGEINKGGYLLKEDDEVKIDHEEESTNLIPEKMPLDIVHEDDDIIVINKENGVVVHPAPGNIGGTLVNGLLYHSTLSDKDPFRPGIVHRIDAYTTGLIVIAKNNKAHEFLAQQITNKKVKRKYLALVWGVIPNDTGLIDAPIGRSPNDRKKMAINAKGKEAVTHFKVLERFKNATLLELELETGRTHQIRVHLNYIGHPVVNDPTYGRKKLLDDSGQCLHAKELEFIHPVTKKQINFNAELPNEFIKIMNYLKGE